MPKIKQSQAKDGQSEEWVQKKAVQGGLMRSGDKCGIH